MESLNINQFFTSWWSAPLHTLLPAPLCQAIALSHQEPHALWSQLFRLHQEVTGCQSRSGLGRGYNFYHDSVVRHLGKRRIALRVVDQGSTVAWTFDQLHRFVNSEVERWQGSLRAGDRVAIVMPFGVHYVVALLSALRLGLTITSLPSDSPLLSLHQIERLLDEVAPTRLLLSRASPPIDKERPRWLIDDLEEGKEPLGREPHEYTPDSLFQISAALYTQEEGTLLPLSAEASYLTALQSSLFAFGLKPDMTFAAPLSCELAEQPARLLTTLLSGATTLHIAPQELLQNPQALKKESLDLLGISYPLRQLWMTTPALPKQGLKFWYTNPFDNEIYRWQAFVQENKLEKIPTGRLLIDTSLGGVTLLTAPCIGRPQTELFPTPGLKWQLRQIGLNDYPSSPSYGSFDAYSTLTPLPDRKPSSGNIILARFGEGWMMGGTVLPNREGILFPIHQIEEAVGHLPFVAQGVVVALPKQNSPINQQFTLLVFVNPREAEELDRSAPAWRQRIQGRITESVGAFYQPEIIEFYPFYPKKNNEVDRNWCLFQYRTGILDKKKKMRIYSLLNLAKQALI